MRDVIMVNRGPEPSYKQFFGLVFGGPLSIMVTLTLFGAWRNSGYKFGNKTLEEWSRLSGHQSEIRRRSIGNRRLLK